MQNGAPDDVDETILSYLHENGRESLDAIAEKTGLSATEVEERVEAMEDEGIITKYTVLTDPTKLGYISVAFGITTDPTKSDEIAQKLKDHENVYKLWIVSGRHNIVLHASFRDITDFQSFSHDTLHGIEGIDRYESSIVTQSVISEGGVVLAEGDDEVVSFTD